MSKRLFLCASTLTKQLYRSWAFRAAAAIVLVGSLVLFWQFRIDSEYIGMLQFSHFAVIALMLMFLLFGARIGRLEYDYHCAELIRSYPDSAAPMAWGRVLVDAVLPFLFSMIILLEVWLLYAAMGANIPLYIFAAQYVLLYYFFPCASCLALGTGIGAMVHSRWMYALLVLIFLFISPISPEVFAYVFEALKTRSEQLHYFFVMLNFSRTRSLEIFPLYGHSLEQARMVAACIRLFIAAGFSLCVCRFPSRKARGITIVLTLCISFLTIQVTNTEENRILFLYGNAQDLSAYTYETDYYWNIGKGNIEYPNADPEKYFRKRAVEVSLDTSLTGLSAACRMDLTCMRASRYQVFTLYRNFCVESVSGEGASISFGQQGDYVTVDFGRIIRAGETVKLEFRYSGASSPMYPANSSYVRLVGSFPWIPDVGATLPSKEYWGSMDALTYTLRAANCDQDPVDYKLNFQSVSERLFTNLRQESAGTWSGRSERGVMLIVDPMLMCDMVDGVEFYYPATVDNQKQVIVERMKQYIAARSSVLDMLGVPAEGQMKRLILMPVPLWMSDDASDTGIDYGDGVYGLYSESAYSLESYSDPEIWQEGDALATMIHKSIVLQPHFVAKMDAQREYGLFSAAFKDQLNQFISEGSTNAGDRAGNLNDEIEWIVSPDDTPETVARYREIYHLLLRLVNETELENSASVWRMWYAQCMTSDADAIGTLIDTVKEQLGDEQP